MKPAVIYISYYFPPIHSVASLRNYYLAAHISPHCQEVRVLTTRNSQLFQQAPKDLSGLQIRQLPTLDYRTLTSFFYPQKKTLHYDESAKRHPILKFLIRLNETWPVSMFFGEGGIIYILSGLWQIKKFLHNSPGDKIVISSFRPASNIWMGYFAKCLFPHILWVVSMHDFPYNHRRPNSYLPQIQKSLWRRLFTKADLVTTLSDGLAKEFQKYHIHTPVIRNGILPRTPISADEEIFTITFTGSLYEGLISPDVFMAGIEDLFSSKKLSGDKIRIVYAGKDSTTWLNQANNYPLTQKVCEIHSLLPHDEALAWQTRSHINLLLTWSDDSVEGILTGKLFEYIGAGNPILAIVNGKKDTELENLFSQFSCGTVLYSTSANVHTQIQKFILKKFELWQSGQYSDSYTPPHSLISHSWEAQSELFWQQISAKLSFRTKNF